MGRKKSRPSRAGGLGAGAAAEPDAPSPSSSTPKSKRAAKGEARRDVCVEVDRSSWGLPDSDRRDLAELVLRDVRLSGEGTKAVDFAALHEKAYKESRFSLRLRVRDAPEEGFRLGQWPVVPSDCVLLEYVIGGGDHEKKGEGGVVLSGRFDGPDEGVSGLAHLVSLRFVTLRVHVFSTFWNGGSVMDPSFRVRMEVMERAFSACESLLEVARHPWRKSLMNMMAWVRPEVTTSATIYGMDDLVPLVDGGVNDDFTPKSDSQFDPAAFYEAVKPSMYVPYIS